MASGVPGRWPQPRRAQPGTGSRQGRQDGLTGVRAVRGLQGRGRVLSPCPPENRRAQHVTGLRSSGGPAGAAPSWTPERCTPAVGRLRGEGAPPQAPQGCVSGAGLGAPHCWRRPHCPSTPSPTQLFTRRPSRPWDGRQSHEPLGLQAPVQGGPAFQHLPTPSSTFLHLLPCSSALLCLPAPSSTFQHIPAPPCENSSSWADCTALLAPGGHLPVPTMPLATGALEGWGGRGRT